MSSHVAVNQQDKTKAVSSALIQNIAVLTFGAILLFAVGFLPMDAVHNAAHDTRHTIAFPCH
ncbi:MAG: CbtB-domain containing protein [Pseudomonadales bacterium]|nr:CbtB-domain containing protein [Pseudomonadales bacterium]